jgi:hypothetical protein
MIKSILLGVFFGVPTIAGITAGAHRPQRSDAQTMMAPACHPSDTVGLELRRFYRALVTATDTNLIRERITVDLPSVSSSAVDLVSDSTTCARALTAFQLATGDTATQRQVYVIGVGPTRYVVTDTQPVRRLDITFDSAFTVKYRRLQ